MSGGYLTANELRVHRELMSKALKEAEQPPSDPYKVALAFWTAIYRLSSLGRRLQQVDRLMTVRRGL